MVLQISQYFQQSACCPCADPCLLTLLHISHSMTMHTLAWPCRYMTGEQHSAGAQQRSRTVAPGAQQQWLHRETAGGRIECSSCEQHGTPASSAAFNQPWLASFGLHTMLAVAVDIVRQNGGCAGPDCSLLLRGLLVGASSACTTFCLACAADVTVRRTTTGIMKVCN